MSAWRAPEQIVLGSKGDTAEVAEARVQLNIEASR
jgi:hypothetical protein